MVPAWILVVLLLGAVASILAVVVISRHDRWERDRSFFIERQLESTKAEVARKLEIAQAKTEAALTALHALFVGRLDNHEIRIQHLESPRMETPRMEGV